jgi:hypothetical protein
MSRYVTVTVEDAVQMLKNHHGDGARKRAQDLMVDAAKKQRLDEERFWEAVDRVLWFQSMPA